MHPSRLRILNCRLCVEPLQIKAGSSFETETSYQAGCNHSRSKQKTISVPRDGDAHRIAVRTSSGPFSSFVVSARHGELARESRHRQIRKESKLVCCSGALSIRDYLRGRSTST